MRQSSPRSSPGLKKEESRKMNKLIRSRMGLERTEKERRAAPPTHEIPDGLAMALALFSSVAPTEGAASRHDAPIERDCGEGEPTPKLCAD